MKSLIDHVQAEIEQIDKYLRESADERDNLRSRFDEIEESRERAEGEKHRLMRALRALEGTDANEAVVLPKLMQAEGGRGSTGVWRV